MLRYNYILTAFPRPTSWDERTVDKMKVLDAWSSSCKELNEDEIYQITKKAQEKFGVDYEKFTVYRTA